MVKSSLYCASETSEPLGVESCTRMISAKMPPITSMMTDVTV